ncbi:hypothetical protein [Jannaschia sp. R86511]|uniref:hypothetical protein n=1 Tax=Jannaschia sp. R86511 TaxID=3093853 RepID=UPI0036D2369E
MIGWYVHDHGSGHRRRLEAVAPHLPVPVVGMGSGVPADGVAWLPLPTDATGRPGAAAVDPTAGGALHWAPLGEAGMLGRAQAVAQWVRDTGCRLLVVDVSVEMLLLARLLGVATVAVVQPGVRDDTAHRLGYDTAATLLAPWPEAAGVSGARSERTAWTGAFSRDDAATGAAVGPACDHDGPCVALVLGAGGHRIDRGQVAAAAAATPGWCWHVAGDLGPAAGPAAGTGRVVEHGTLPDVRGLLQHASVVVGPSGGGLVAEVAAAGRPFLALPQPRPFDEQHELARLLARLGCAEVATTWPSPPEWAGLLTRLAAGSPTAPGRWARWSDGHGAERAAALLLRTLRAVTPGATVTPGASAVARRPEVPVSSGATR